jgi:hypothetical protein
MGKIKIFTVALWVWVSAFALLFIAAIVATVLDAAGVIDLPEIDLPEIDVPEGESSDYSTPYDDPFWPPAPTPPPPPPPLPQPPLR